MNLKQREMACSYFAQVKDEIHKDCSLSVPPQRSNSYLALCIPSGQSLDLARRVWRERVIKEAILSLTREWEWDDRGTTVEQCLCIATNIQSGAFHE